MDDADQEIAELQEAVTLLQQEIEEIRGEFTDRFESIVRDDEERRKRSLRKELGSV